MIKNNDWFFKGLRENPIRLDDDKWFSNYKQTHCFTIEIRGKKKFEIYKEAKNSSNEGCLYWRNNAYNNPQAWINIFETHGVQIDDTLYRPYLINTIKYLHTTKYIKIMKQIVRNNMLSGVSKSDWVKVSRMKLELKGLPND